MVSTFHRYIVQRISLSKWLLLSMCEPSQRDDQRRKNWPKNQHFVRTSVTVRSPSIANKDIVRSGASSYFGSKRGNFPRDFVFALMTSVPNREKERRSTLESPVRDDSWCSRTHTHTERAPVKLKVVESGLELSPVMLLWGLFISRFWSEGVGVEEGDSV